MRCLPWWRLGRDRRSAPQAIKAAAAQFGAACCQLSRLSACLAVFCPVQRRPCHGDGMPLRATAVETALQASAQRMLDTGPPPLTVSQVDLRRRLLADLLDDLRDVGDDIERAFIVEAVVGSAQSCFSRCGAAGSDQESGLADLSRPSLVGLPTLAAVDAARERSLGLCRDRVQDACHGTWRCMGRIRGH